VPFFVTTLNYSRRIHVRAFASERREHWFEGMESAFAAFGGVTAKVLLDNARALILSQDAASREVVVQPEAPRLRAALGLPSSGTDQRQGRTRRRLCQTQ
jgi:transposase